MKNTLFFLTLILSISKLDGQVSIGSTVVRDATILDIVSSTKGVLLPRVELSSLDSKSPLTGNIQNGTLIFNTKPNGIGVNKVFTGFYEWYNDKWRLPITSTSSYKVAKFLNNPNDQSVNWNPSTTTSPLKVSIFNTQDFNDDITLFQRIDETSVRINQTGTYVVTSNLGFQLFPINTINSTIEIYFQYALNDVRASSRVLSRVTQQDGASVNGRFFYNMTDYINVTTPGQVLTLQAWRNNTFPTTQYVRYDSGVTSSIVIQKLR